MLEALPTNGIRESSESARNAPKDAGRTGFSRVGERSEATSAGSPYQARRQARARSMISAINASLPRV